MNALEFCGEKGEEGLFEFPGDCESFAQCYQMDGKIIGAKKVSLKINIDVLSFSPRLPKSLHFSLSTI